jgi:tetratricopeptide (TPR) repeat protein
VPALRKPHRIAVLAPSLTIDGPDAPYAREAALLVWAACLETCQRHPGLAVYDPESTPPFPQDGHFVPQHATPGATPADAFWASTRRDELVWLELALPKAPVVRLHALGRAGERETFEATGRNLGEQVHQVLGAWLAARGLPPSPRRFEPVTVEELIAAVRAIGPLLVEQAGKWTAHGAAAPAWPEDAGAEDAEADAGGEDAGGAGAGAGAEARPTAVMQAVSGMEEAAADAVPGEPARRPRSAPGRGLANRLPAPLRVAALRALELALREDLGDLILAADPDHPRALFAQLQGRLDRGAGPDHALLRRVIAGAPGWARPYAELAREGDPAPLAPTVLEAVAGAGIATLCRPGQLDVMIAAAELLCADGRADEALRLMERARRLHDGDPRAHVALLGCHRATGRVGGWLAQAHRSARAHGCPADPALPWYPDQIQIDLLLADALLAAGRLDDAIALRANRLDGRAAAWPRHARILERWRTDPAVLARSFAREGAFRGDPGRVLEGFGRAAPAGDLELALLLDALVALGREDEVPLAWAELGLGLGHAGPISRLAAARGLLAAGEWRRGLEELWRVELAAPERDEQAAIARIGLVVSAMPLEIAETALAERLAVGAVTLARRMARDVADFVPHAAKSSIVLRALGQGARAAAIDFDPAWLAPLPLEPAARLALDALFADADGRDPVARGDRLVERWLEALHAHASEDEPAAFVQAAAYVAAQALVRYLAGTTAAPSPFTGALRLVAAEALALVRRHREALADREARAMLAAVEPLLRRVDRWLGTAWLATLERSCGIDERAGGDVAGFARESATVAARILGPEEVAVLSASIARLHRERPEGWEAATGAQAGRLALHTGFVGVDEWADATVAQLAARAQDADDAIDALLTASYLAEGRSAVPCVHAARVLFDAGRAPAALAVLTAGLGAAAPDVRARQLAQLAGTWRRAKPGVPLALDEAAAAAAEALDQGEAARAEKLGRWAIALDPSAAAAHRTLGAALARQGKVADALHHLVRAAPGEPPGDAIELLGARLGEAGKHAEAAAVRAYGSRRADRAEAAGALERPRARTGPDRPLPGLATAHEAAFAQLEAGNFAGAAARADDPSWRVRRAALAATRFRSPSENEHAVTPRALAAALAVLAETSGVGRPAAAGGASDRDALLCRMTALEIREGACLARDPAPRLGERMAREAFHRAHRARGGAAAAEEPPAPPPFADRAIVPGAKVARASDYVALLRDLAALTPREALAQFDLDEPGYLEVATAWAAAIDEDPGVAALIAAGLAKR